MLFWCTKRCIRKPVELLLDWIGWWALWHNGELWTFRRRWWSIDNLLHFLHPVFLLVYCLLEALKVFLAIGVTSSHVSDGLSCNASNLGDVTETESVAAQDFDAAQ